MAEPVTTDASTGPGAGRAGLAHGTRVLLTIAVMVWGHGRAPRP